MKKIVFAGIVSFVMALALLPTLPAQATPYCGITWGSLAKTATSTGSVSLTNVRTGRNDCYDRMVFDMNGPASGYDVSYVSTVYSDGAGTPISLSGGAKLKIVVKAPAYNVKTGAVTYKATVNKALPNVNLAGYKTFRDAKYAGSFEGQSTVGLGVRAKLPFRVFKLDSRLVVDVAHNW